MMAKYPDRAGTGVWRIGVRTVVACLWLLALGPGWTSPPDVQPARMPEPSVLLASLQVESCDLTRLPLPDESRTRSLVAISYTVSADGRLKHLEVTGESPDQDFDSRLAQQLHDCSFRPGHAPASDGSTHGVLLAAQGAWPAASRLPQGVRKSPGPTAATQCRPTLEDWPAASLRAAESGTIALRAWVQADGRLRFIEVLGSTGHPRLDHAAVLLIARCDVQPGTDDTGRPRGGYFETAISWRVE